MTQRYTYQQQAQDQFFFTPILMKKSINQRLALPIILLIKLYQYTLSPDKGIPSRRLKGRICHHQPHCSEYSIQALKHYGCYPGILYMLERISSCTGATTIKQDPITYKVVFFSSAPIGIPFLKKLNNDNRYEIVGIVSNEEKQAGRGMKTHANIIIQTAKQLGFTDDKLQTPPSLRIDSKKYREEATAFGQRLKDKKADFLIVVAYGKIIPAYILDAANIAAINVHGSILPQYRGASPIQSVFLDNQTTSGITIMKMDAGLDTGDILSILKTTLPFNWTAKNLVHWMETQGPKLLVNSVRSYAKGHLIAKKQNDSKASHCGKLEKEQAQIDPFYTPLEQVYNIYRGCYLWPKAHYVLDENRGTHQDKRIIIEDMLLDEKKFYQTKNEPLFIHNHNKLTKNEAVTKLILKPEGKKAIEREEFSKGYHHQHIQQNDSHTEERLDLVDSEDKVIKKETRENIYKWGLSNFRCVNIIIQNEKKQILVPLRDEKRKIFPNCFDFSCAEHVKSGEIYRQAAIRGLKEELHIDTSDTNLQELVKLTPHQHQVSCFQTIYVLRYNKPIVANKKEGVEKLEWMSLAQLRTKMKIEPQKFKGDMLIVLQHVEHML